MITVEEAKKEIGRLYSRQYIISYREDKLEKILWELIKSHRLLECPNCQCSLDFKE